MTYLALLFLLIPSVAMADYLGCYEPGETVEIKTLYLDADGSSADTVTSAACDVFDPNDAEAGKKACTTGPTLITGSTGLYESTYLVPALSATEVEGIWHIRSKGTISSVVKEGLGDNFEVRAMCSTDQEKLVTTDGTPSTTVVSVESNGIAADNDYVGYKLRCGLVSRYITKTLNAGDDIHVEYGNPFPVAPGTGDTCSIEKP